MAEGLVSNAVVGVTVNFCTEMNGGTVCYGGET